MNTKHRPVALVTGASGGIGAACAKELHAFGCDVIIHYNSNEAAAREVQSSLPGSHIFQANLSEENDIDALVAFAKDKGGVDILVNNAGMTADAPFLMTRMEDFDKVFNVNLKSTFLLSKKLTKMMIRKKQGRIINISSVIGATGNSGQSIYGMTKAALINLTKTLSYELGPYNILVNSVAPGFIETPMTIDLPEEVKEKIFSRVPLNRFGAPEEVAKLVRFLALEGSYCTGSTFHVNGGMYGV